MLFFYIRDINLVEATFQIIILYNIFQFLKQINFYYLIAYFFLTILYLGIFLIIYDLDLNCVILWVIYGGICIVFFIYSLMWFEVFKNLYKNNSFQKKFYFLPIILSSLFFNYKHTNIDYQLNNKFYINYYLMNELDKLQELEMLGWGIIYYTTFLFILFSYFLLINCIVVTILNSNSKKIKNNLLNHYYIYFLKNKNLYHISFIKNQHFFIQDYENNNQNYSLVKNYKITNYFHQIKNIKRRV